MRLHCRLPRRTWHNRCGALGDRALPDGGVRGALPRSVDAAIKRIKERAGENTNSDGLKKGFTNVMPWASRH